jgi:hypothetical protein
MPAVAKKSRSAGSPGAENADPQAPQPPYARLLPTGDLLPRITVQSVRGDTQLWAVDLDAVDDDLESRYLAAKGDEMAFTLDVPGKGIVDGVLWCAPRSRCLSPIFDFGSVRAGSCSGFTNVPAEAWLPEAMLCSQVTSRLIQQAEPSE